jgi:hypothetical protein
MMASGKTGGAAVEPVGVEALASNPRAPRTLPASRTLSEEQAMDMPLSSHDPLRAARAMMERYGLRAAAMAEAHAAEAQAAGETAQVDHWQSVSAAIAELRRTKPATH